MIHSLLTSPRTPSPMEGKIPLLGRTVATPSALAAVPVDKMQAALSRHHPGDWSVVDDDDLAGERAQLRKNLCLELVFQTKDGVKFYIITEHDRSATPVLLS